MKLLPIAFKAKIAMLVVTSVVAGASASPLAIGDTYEITRIVESAQQDSHGSTGTTYDKDTIIERVTGLRPDGVELEYDLPKSVTADQRASTWQMPARVFAPVNGPAQLLNAPELEAKVDGWLKAAGLARAACGHWIFTWNAFRIECDPQSALEMVASFDLGPADLSDGAPYRDAQASASGTLVRKSGGGHGATFTVEMPIDPDAVRRARAESDVGAGEIMHKPMTLDAALAERAKETISGTITITFETDASGAVRRRIKVTKLDIKGIEGKSEELTATETLERRRIG